MKLHNNWHMKIYSTGLGHLKGVTTLSITFSITTLSITKFSITTLSIMTFSTTFK
jgi:hypothetical protein